MLILRKAGKHWLNLHILRKHKILDHLPSVMSMHFWCFYFFEFLNFWVNWTTERSTVFLKNSKKFLVQVAPEPSSVEMLRHLILCFWLLYTYSWVRESKNWRYFQFSRKLKIYYSKKLLFLRIIYFQFS